MGVIQNSGTRNDKVCILYLHINITIPAIYHMVYTQIQVDLHHRFCFYNFYLQLT